MVRRVNSVEIDPACDRLAEAVFAIPDNLLIACPLKAIGEGYDLLSQEVIDLNPDLAVFRKAIGDGGCGIERIGIVLRQEERSGYGSFIANALRVEYPAGITIRGK